MGIERGDLRKKISMLFYSCFSQNDFRQIQTEPKVSEEIHNETVGFRRGLPVCHEEEGISWPMVWPGTS